MNEELLHAINGITEQLRQLGYGNAWTEGMGATELHAMKIHEGLGTVAESIDRLTRQVEDLTGMLRNRLPEQ